MAGRAPLCHTAATTPKKAPPGQRRREGASAPPNVGHNIVTGGGDVATLPPAADDAAFRHCSGRGRPETAERRRGLRARTPGRPGAGGGGAQKLVAVERAGEMKGM